MQDATGINVCLKTIADLQIEETKFYIDAYQRGYRWSKNEVYALLEDIREFSQTTFKGINGEADKFYCLQPIIVTLKKNNEWKIIDGQQRLTTLFLIYIFYNKNLSGTLMQSLPPFELHYKNKKYLEDCLLELINGDYLTEEDFEKINYFMNDIDCYFIIEAYKEISKYFNTLISNPKLRNQVTDMKTVFDNYMKIIWYELQNCDEQKEISMFTKINMGKIPLTNSELIKALLLRNEDESLLSYQENIAIKWDDIEAKLLDDSFWAFLVNNTDMYSTRIDFIFEIMSHDINESILKMNSYNNESYYIEKKYNSNYFSFYVMNNYMRYLVNIGEKRQDIIKKIWDKICEYYRMFNDWYRNKTWFHLIGYIIYISGENSIEKIYELSEIYMDDSSHEYGHKTYFELTLKNMTKKTLLQNKCDKDNFIDLISNLSYGHDNKAIKNVLLIYNLAVLEVEEQTNVRFAFEKFKLKNAWDIEHINAIADARPYDDNDTDTNERLVWLNSALNLPNIDDIYKNDEKIKDCINKIITNKLYLPKNDDTEFINVYESIIVYFNDLSTPNGLGNLTLLDSGINRAYRNEVFPSKRKEIIKKCCSEKYIPLATKKVFFKAYADAKNLLKWTQEDYDNYIDDIIDKISIYLDIKEDETNE